MPNFSDKVVSPWYDVNVNGVPKTELPSFTTFDREQMLFSGGGGYPVISESVISFGPSAFFIDGNFCSSFVYKRTQSNSYYAVAILPSSSSITSYLPGQNSFIYSDVNIFPDVTNSIGNLSPMVCVPNAAARYSGGRIIQGSSSIGGGSYAGCYSITQTRQSSLAIPVVSQLAVSEPNIEVSTPVLFGNIANIIVNNSSVYQYVAETNSVFKVGNISSSITQELNAKPSTALASTRNFLHRYTHWDTIGSIGGSEEKRTIINTMRHLYIGKYPYDLARVFSPPNQSDIISAVCYSHIDSSWLAVVTSNNISFDIYKGSVDGLSWSLEKSNYSFINPGDNSSVQCADPISIFPFRGTLFLSAFSQTTSHRFINTIDYGRYLNWFSNSFLATGYYSQPHVSIYNDSKMSFLANPFLKAPVIAGHNTIVI